MIIAGFWSRPTVFFFFNLEEFGQTCLSDVSVYLSVSFRCTAIHFALCGFKLLSQRIASLWALLLEVKDYTQHSAQTDKIDF